MNTVKGILFDKDGTLIDFNRSWLAPYLKATSYLAQSVGRPELADTLMANGGYLKETQSWVPDSLLASGSNQQILDAWSLQIGEPIQGERLETIYAIFSLASDSYVAVIDDMNSFLQSLKRRGIKLGVATMDDVSNAHEMINKLSLSGIFDFVCGANSGFGVKPEPGMVHGFCAQCGLDPNEIMMVGDSPRDLNMGKNAGVKMSVGVLTGAHSEEELRQYGDAVIKNISEIPSLLNDD